MRVWSYLLVIAVAAIVTLVVTPIVRSASLRRGLVDRPGGRKVHTEPISRLGGVGIFAGVMIALGFELAAERFGLWGPVLAESPQFGLIGVIGGMIAMFAIGLADDVYNLKPGLKFAGQLAAAGLVVASELRVDFLADPVGGGIVMLGLLGYPITLIYIAGFTNVINLIDGLDGLAAGVTAIAATSLLILAAQQNRFDAAMLAAAVIGACLGFLRYNFNPASIFMGDSGALFLGFTLACISLMGAMKSVAAIALAVPLIIIGIPIFDTASAIIRRIRHKRPIQEADRGHIHHRLLGRGFDQRQTVLIIYVWCIALGLGAYAIRYAPGAVRLLALVSLFAVTGGMAYWLGLFEAAHHHDEDEDAESVTHSTGA